MTRPQVKADRGNSSTRFPFFQVNLVCVKVRKTASQPPLSKHIATLDEAVEF